MNRIVSASLIVVIATLMLCARPVTAGTLFIANYSGNNVKAYDLGTNSLTTVATVNNASGLTLGFDSDSNGQLDLYATSDGVSITRYNAEAPYNLLGTFRSSTDGATRGSGYSASAGLIYQGSISGSGVAEYNSAGTLVGHITTVTGSGATLYTYDASVSPSGSVWFSGNDSVNAGPSASLYTLVGSTATAVYTEANSLFAKIAFDPNNPGRVYFTNATQNKVEYWDGSIHVISDALFNGPSGIAFDKAGTMYVSNTGDNTLVYSTGGAFSYATNLGPGNSSLNVPVDVAFFAPVPEPASATLLGVAGALLLKRRARQ
jgi:hypothetical protein